MRSRMVVTYNNSKKQLVMKKALKKFLNAECSDWVYIVYYTIGIIFGIIGNILLF